MGGAQLKSGVSQYILPEGGKKASAGWYKVNTGRVCIQESRCQSMFINGQNTILTPDT